MQYRYAVNFGALSTSILTLLAVGLLGLRLGQHILEAPASLQPGNIMFDGYVTLLYSLFSLSFSLL